MVIETPRVVKRMHIKLYTPHASQRIFHECKSRYRVLPCGRRWGKSLCFANEILKFSCDHPGTMSAWIAPYFRQSKRFYRMIKNAVKDAIAYHSDSDLRLVLINGSTIEFWSADNPDAARSAGLHFVVFDEAADIDSYMWTHVVRPMLSDTNGKAVFGGTPKGRNWFYHLFMRGQDELEIDWWSRTFPTSDNPYIPAGEIEEAKKDLPEDVFDQEYLAVFHAESAGAFRGVDFCIEGEFLEPQRDTYYEIGWDVAKRTDFSVFTVLNLSTMHVDYWYRTNQVDYTVQIEKAKELTTLYNNAHMLMDATGVGDAVMEMATNADISVDGYQYAGNGKKYLIERAIVGVEQRAFTFPDIPILINELKSMQFKFTPGRVIQYAAPSGGHDDAVNSLALAYMASSGGIPIATSGQSVQRAEAPTQTTSIEDALLSRHRLLENIGLVGRFGN